MKTLLLIDIQNDVLPGGALAVPDGDAVIPVANQLMDSFPLVVATQDWHPAGHGSFASGHADKAPGEVIDLDGVSQVLWPDHCVQGTSGAEFATTLNTDRVDHVIQKGTQPEIDSYSGFFDNARRHQTGLDALLRGAGVTELCIVGLATDYCVRFTALDAIDLGYPTRLVTAGCRGVELAPGDVDAALEEMRSAGVVLEART